MGGVKINKAMGAAPKVPLRGDEEGRSERNEERSLDVYARLTLPHLPALSWMAPAVLSWAKKPSEMEPQEFALWLSHNADAIEGSFNLGDLEEEQAASLQLLESSACLLSAVSPVDSVRIYEMASNLADASPYEVISHRGQIFMRKVGMIRNADVLGRNLLALDAMEVMREEGKALELDRAQSIPGHMTGLMDWAVRGDGKNQIDDLQEAFDQETDLFQDVRKRLRNGSQYTIHDALVSIAEQGPENQKRLAQSFLDAEGSARYDDLVPHLIRYAHATAGDSEEFLLRREADTLLSKHGAAKSYYAANAVLALLSQDAESRRLSQANMKFVLEGGSWGDTVLEFLKKTGTDDLLELAIGGGAAKLGSLIQLALFEKLTRVNVPAKAARILSVMGGGAAGGVFSGTSHLIKDAMSRNVDDVFSSRNVALIYALSVIGGTAGGGTNEFKSTLLRFVASHGVGLGTMMSVSRDTDTDLIRYVLGAIKAKVFSPLTDRMRSSSQWRRTSVAPTEPGQRDTIPGSPIPEAFGDHRPTLVSPQAQPLAAKMKVTVPVFAPPPSQGLKSIRASNASGDSFEIMTSHAPHSGMGLRGNIAYANVRQPQGDSVRLEIEVPTPGKPKEKNLMFLDVSRHDAEALGMRFKPNGVLDASQPLPEVFLAAR